MVISADFFYKGGEKPQKRNDFVWELRYHRLKKIPKDHSTQYLRLQMEGPLKVYFHQNDPIRIDLDNPNNIATITNLKTNQHISGKIMKK
jgi:hypothetical protein